MFKYPPVQVHRPRYFSSFRNFSLKRPVNHQWFASQINSDRKSEFQGRVVTISEEGDIDRAIELFKRDHKRLMKSASHPYIYAWRLGTLQTIDCNHDSSGTEQDKKSNVVSADIRKQQKKDPKLITKYVNVREGYYDCGEKTGGSELMRRTLHRYDLYNVMVIVTRWMHGSGIGLKRFKHIGTAGYESLRIANLLNKR